MRNSISYQFYHESMIEFESRKKGFHTGGFVTGNLDGSKLVDLRRNGTPLKLTVNGVEVKLTEAADELTWGKVHKAAIQKDFSPKWRRQYNEVIGKDIAMIEIRKNEDPPWAE